MTPNRIVITGAPGTGKTTLIKALKNEGFLCFDEISRAIINEYQLEGIPNPFKTHAVQFSDRLFTGRVQQFTVAKNSSQKTAFYDRAIHDVIAYLQHTKSTIPNHYIATAKKNTYTSIFITPPWEAIYTKDNERFESFEEATKIHKSLINTYRNFGYTPIEIPLESVSNRVSFILKKLL